MDSEIEFINKDSMKTELTANVVAYDTAVREFMSNTFYYLTSIEIK